MLNQNLHNIHFPISCIECHDYFCVNDTHRSDITRQCNELITSCLSAGRSVFPMCFPRKPLKPYFNNIIAPHKDQSLLWYAIWVNAGRPREEILAQIMRQTRAKYHYFIHWAHNNQSHLKWGRMAEAIANNDSRNFWQECKRISGYPKSVSNIVDGITGDDHIAELFARKYQGVYNSVPIAESDMSNIKCEINRRLVTENNVDIACIDSGEVHDAIKRLNAGKDDGDIGMYSNHILLANDIFMKHISNLFSMMLSHGYTPEYMIRAVITSIPKNVKESVACSENYRGIALSSILGKVFDLIIIQRYGHALSSSDLQFSFKERHSTVMCSAAIK